MKMKAKVCKDHEGRIYGAEVKIIGPRSVSVQVDTGSVSVSADGKRVLRIKEAETMAVNGVRQDTYAISKKDMESVMRILKVLSMTAGTTKEVGGVLGLEDMDVLLARNVTSRGWRRG